jgi:hypothetical protein
MASNATNSLNEFTFYPEETDLRSLRIAIWTVTGIALCLCCAMCFHTEKELIAAMIAGSVLLGFFITGIVFSLKKKPFDGDEHMENLFFSPAITLTTQCGYDNAYKNATSTTVDDAPEFIPFHECIALVIEVLCLSLILPEITSAQLKDEGQEETRQQNSWIKWITETKEKVEEKVENETENQLTRHNIIVANHENIKYIINGLQDYYLIQSADREVEREVDPENKNGRWRNKKKGDERLVQRIAYVGNFHAFLDFVIPIVTNLMQVVALVAGLWGFFGHIGGNRDHLTNWSSFCCWWSYMISMAYYKPILLPWCKLSISAQRGMGTLTKKHLKEGREQLELRAQERARKKEEHETRNAKEEEEPDREKEAEEDPPLVEIAWGLVGIFVPLILLPVAMFGANYLTSNPSFGGDEYFATSQWIMWFLNDMWDLGEINFVVNFKLIFSFDYSFELPSEIALSLSSIAILIDFINLSVIKNFTLYVITSMILWLPAYVTRPVVTFTKIDRDHSGTITRGELSAAKHRLGKDITDKKLDKVFDEMNSNKENDKEGGEEVVDFEEFVNFLVAKEAEKNEQNELESYETLEGTLAAIFEAPQADEAPKHTRSASENWQIQTELRPKKLKVIKRKKSERQASITNIPVEDKAEIEETEVAFMAWTALGAYGLYIVLLAVLVFPTTVLFFPTMLMFFACTFIWLALFVGAVFIVSSLLLRVWGGSDDLVMEFAGW